MTAQKKMAQEFTQKTGIKVNIVAVAEDQFDQAITSAAAADTLPDVVAALPLSALRTLESGDLLDTDTAKKVVDDLGADTFAARSLDLTKDGDKQLGVPSDGWGQLLVYRRDLFDKAGLDAPTTYDKIQQAAQALNGKNGVAGITLATAPGSSFTEQTFEYLAQANGCELVDNDKKVTLDSPQCVRTFDFYSNLAKNYSVKGNQTDDSTRATYFAGKAAMIIWSSFILDEMAGLRKDALPSCPECKSVPSFLAQNSGIVTSIQGPDGKEPSSFGEIVSFATTTSAPKDSAAKFIEYMMSDAYTAVARPSRRRARCRPGRAPSRATRRTWTPGRSSRPASTPRRRCPTSTTRTCSRRCRRRPRRSTAGGCPQGQGALVGAMQGPLPVPKALSDLINGKGDATAAAQSAQKAVEDLQKDTN